MYMVERGTTGFGEGAHRAQERIHFIARSLRRAILGNEVHDHFLVPLFFNYRYIQAFQLIVFNTRTTLWRQISRSLRFVSIGVREVCVYTCISVYIRSKHRRVDLTTHPFPQKVRGPRLQVRRVPPSLHPDLSNENLGRQRDTLTSTHGYS